MNFLKKIIQEADLLLFYAYIWQIPFAWRLILIPNRGDSAGIFNEYMDISLYLGEVLLLLSWSIYIYKHKNYKKSILIHKIKITAFHVEHYLFFLFVIFILFNILSSIDLVLSLVATFHFGSIFLAAYLFSRFFVSRGTKVFNDIACILFLSLIFQLIVGIFQTYTGHSLGINWLSESKISIENFGIAKSEILGVTVLRGYGTFPHPNVFAAYALFTAIYFLFISKLFHVKRYYIDIAILISLISVLVAQSKLLSFLMIILALNHFKNKFHVELKLITFITIFFIVTGLSVLYGSDIQKSLDTRLDQLHLQNGYQSNFFIGSGIGTYRLSYESIANNQDWWLLEPVHNMLYIYFCETGGLGVLILLAVIGFYLSKVPRGTMYTFMYIPIFIICMVLTDHYGWDIYQGQQIFILAAVLFLRSNTLIDKIYYKLYYNL